MTNIYPSFAQAHADIKDLTAIDYFFAKEMLLALTVEQDQQHILQGLFFALNTSLRAGHTCLAINELANSQWGVSSVKGSAESSHESLNEELGDKLNESLDESLNKQNVPNGFSFPALTQLNTILVNLDVSEHDLQPIVYKENKLYLRRYFQFETELTAFISQRLGAKSLFSAQQVQQTVEQLFPDNEENSQSGDDSSALDWQKIAVANAINKNFSVIAGGPGTGKTYTVTKLLAALVMLNSHDGNSFKSDKSATSDNKSLNIALVAPTGKAAQRLSESIVNAVTGFKDQIADTVLAQIPSNAQTIHRLLGVIPNNANFRHNQKNLLPYDIVLIDEVSMVDLPLMTRIFRALKSDAKVILLGDADQLPSVAAGSVLADIAPRPHGGYSDNNLAYLADTCRLSKEILRQQFSHIPAHLLPNSLPKKADYLTFLVKSRRFDGQGGIGLLANAVIAGDSRASWQLLTDAAKDANMATNNDNVQLSLATSALNDWLAPLVKQYYQPIEQCSDIHQAFTSLAKFRVLCATRQGDYGVESINDKIKTMLGKQWKLGKGLGHKNRASMNQSQALYHGQPIMISENDYTLGLYNGDIGLVWRVLSAEGIEHLMVSFQDESSEEPSIRQILPSRLPKFETVYAMTIHKTQGSEFNHVAMAISPPETLQFQSKLLTRELLYTGITRAKNKLTIASHQKTWSQGVNAQVKRNSGLFIASDNDS